MRAEKHSITLGGRKTSFAVEPAYKAYLCDVAAARGVSFNELAGQIVEAAAGKLNMSAALRLWAFEHAAGRAAGSRL